jgi:hypothetical protein
MLRPPRFPSRALSFAFLLSAVTSVPIAGCVSDKAKVAEPPATCVKLGDICTFSPGKLGLCVESTSDSEKLVCQSQH